MNSMSCTDFNIKAPTLYVEPLASLRENSLVPFELRLLQDASYIPLVSNIKAIAGVALAIILAAVSVPAIVIGGALLTAYALGYTGPNLRDAAGAPDNYATKLFGDRNMSLLLAVGAPDTYATKLFGTMSLVLGGALIVGSVTLVGRSILESIPVAGNLALGFLDRRIQINPQSV